MQTITITNEQIDALDELGVIYTLGDTVYKTTPLLEMVAFGLGIFIGSGFGTFIILYFSNLLE